MALLEARNLRKTYRLGKAEGVQALRGVDVTIDTGEMVAIMGPSGSGKTTLMHILGLLHQPDLDGTPGPSLVIGGRDMTKLSDGARTRTRAEHLGFVFQSYNLVPTLTAEENILLPLAIAGRSPDREWYDSVIATVNLRDRLGHKPHELSGGQQQRVAVARALVSRPTVVFADEPTGNLDSKTGAEILELLRGSVEQLGQTTVMVTHDPYAAAIADRILFLADGVIVRDLPRSEASAVISSIAWITSLGSERGSSFTMCPSARKRIRSAIDAERGSCVTITVVCPVVSTA
jgi:putative ABC transport system ATP-binding protein